MLVIHQDKTVLVQHFDYVICCWTQCMCLCYFPCSLEAANKAVVKLIEIQKRQYQNTFLQLNSLICRQCYQQCWPSAWVSTSIGSRSIGSKSIGSSV